jgi:hypothetical protein
MGPGYITIDIKPQVQSNPIALTPVTCRELYNKTSAEYQFKPLVTDSGRVVDFLRTQDSNKHAQEIRAALPISWLRGDEHRLRDHARFRQSR